MIAGVCAALGDRYGLSVRRLRLAFVLFGTPRAGLDAAVLRRVQLRVSATKRWYAASLMPRFSARSASFLVLPSACLRR